MDWTSSVLRVLLVEETSTYEFDPDDATLDDINTGGLVEPTDGSYARQTLTTPTVTQDDTNDQALYDADDVSFGNLAGSEVVIGYLVYVQVGGDDTTPADDIPVCYADSVEDATLDGTPFVLEWDPDGVITFV